MLSATRSTRRRAAWARLYPDVHAAVGGAPAPPFLALLLLQQPSAASVPCWPAHSCMHAGRLACALVLVLSSGCHTCKGSAHHHLVILHGLQRCQFQPQSPYACLVPVDAPGSPWAAVFEDWSSNCAPVQGVRTPALSTTRLCVTLMAVESAWCLNRTCARSTCATGWAGS